MVSRWNCFLTCLMSLACSVGIAAEPAATPGEVPAGKTDQFLPSQAEAAQRAALLHDAMHATLQLVHHRYYQEDEGLIIPAATLREIFQDLEKEHNLKIRWLVVDGQAMNSEHVPADDFEKQAARDLHDGKKFIETTQNGVYRRAGAITLSNVCLKCHVPDRKSTKNQTAGLLISFPISGQ